MGRYQSVLKEMEIDIDIEYVGNRFGADIEASLNYIKGFGEKEKEIIVTRGYLAQEIRKSLFREIASQLETCREFYGEEETAVSGMTLREAEDVLIERALKESGYNKTKAAEKLGIDRVTLIRRLRKKETGGT